MNTEEIEKILLSSGVKPTSNRILVARQLLDSSNPVSLADLEMELDSLDKSSIFRVLELLAERDVVHVIDDGSRSLKYEMCLSHGHHSMADQHAHFHCEQCGQTLCLEDVKIPVIDLPAGFIPRAVNYVMKGICSDCASKNP